jgi:hypothetical protein
MVCFFLSASVTLLLLQWMMHVAFPSFYEYTNKKSEAVLIQFVFIIYRTYIGTTYNQRKRMVSDIA